MQVSIGAKEMLVESFLLGNAIGKVFGKKRIYLQPSICYNRRKYFI